MLATAIALLIAAAAIAAGRDHIWKLAGQPDLGAIDFTVLVRRTEPNDALVCLPSICHAKIDIESPVFSVPVPQLRLALTKMIESEPRVEPVASDEVNTTYRYVQRSMWMHFPDTIVVRLLQVSGGRSTVLLYSRSQLGRNDFGVNRARLRRWLDKLQTRLSSS